jgi:hypothetical protein
MYMTWFRLSSGSLNRWAVLPLYGNTILAIRGVASLPKGRMRACGCGG